MHYILHALFKKVLLYSNRMQCMVDNSIKIVITFVFYKLIIMVLLKFSSKYIKSFRMFIPTYVLGLYVQV